LEKKKEKKKIVYYISFKAVKLPNSVATVPDKPSAVRYLNQIICSIYVLLHFKKKKKESINLFTNDKHGSGLVYHNTPP